MTRNTIHDMRHPLDFVNSVKSSQIVKNQLPITSELEVRKRIDHNFVLQMTEKENKCESSTFLFIYIRSNKRCAVFVLKKKNDQI